MTGSGYAARSTLRRGLPGTRRVGRPHRRRAGAHPDRPLPRKPSRARRSPVRGLGHVTEIIPVIASNGFETGVAPKIQW